MSPLKHALPGVFAFLALAFASVGSTQAAVTFDDTVTNQAIYGSGNQNDPSWVIFRQGSYEAAVRSHVRFPVPQNIYNSNGAGAYSFAAGNFGPGGIHPSWNFDVSFNSNYNGTGTNSLTGIDLELLVDYDPGPGTNFLTISMLGVPFADHSFGNNSTLQGAGVEATDPLSFAALIANSNLVQQSGRTTFFIGPQPFDPAVPGVYTVQLNARRNGELLAAVAANNCIGDVSCINPNQPRVPVVQVPEPATLAMFIGLVGLLGLGRWSPSLFVRSTAV